MAKITDCAPTILDGFTMDASWLYQARFLQPYAVGRLEAIRRAQGMVNRYYVAPLSSQTPLQIRDVVFIQIRVPLGTVIWGFGFWDDAAGSFEVQQVEETKGRQLFSEPLQPGMSPGVIYMVEPFTVSASGGISVSIAVGDSPDPSSPDFPAQFVLFCAEPVIKEIQCP